MILSGIFRTFLSWWGTSIKIINNQKYDIFNCLGVDIDNDGNEDDSDHDDEEEPNEDYVEVE